MDSGDQGGFRRPMSDFAAVSEWAASVGKGTATSRAFNMSARNDPALRNPGRPAKEIAQQGQSTGMSYTELS